ncbi:ATP-binding protein [Kitasatospora sp. NBC_01300]|uniref:ATP-binding protein n=1 Tax=Kitasatospora sp. NBC_01300 TaxID=2903574 RepID=UPI002F91B692|nr:ATP-binding protein [Kitasatospora sp. NBC_01300]
MTPPVQPSTEDAMQTSYKLREAHLAAEHIPLIRALAVARCRRWLADRGIVLGGPGQDAVDAAVQDAMLVLTELLTNVIKHVIHRGTCWPPSDEPVTYRDAPEWVELDLVLEETSVLTLLIVVRDGDPGGPMLDTTEPGDFEGGLGLGLVRAVSNDQWGWEPTGGGKAVWARCPLAALN